jgi:hypothetical protein
MRTLAFIAAFAVFAGPTAFAKDKENEPAQTKVKPPQDVREWLRLGNKWLTEQKRLEESGDKPVGGKEMLEHYGNLHVLRVSFERLERRGELSHLGEGRRTAVRHLLAEILGRSLTVEHSGNALTPALGEAHESSKEDVAALTGIANRRFDFDFTISKD